MVGVHVDGKGVQQVEQPGVHPSADLLVLEEQVESVEGTFLDVLEGGEGHELRQQVLGLTRCLGDCEVLLGGAKEFLLRLQIQHGLEGLGLVGGSGTRLGFDLLDWVVLISVIPTELQHEDEVVSEPLELIHTGLVGHFLHIQ
jgi:hypothetical protein